MKPAITKTKKAAIPAANGRSVARAIAKNETEKAAAIAEASRLMKLGVVIKAALRFSFGSCPGLVSPTLVSDLFSDRSETVSDLFSARSETNGPPPNFFLNCFV